MITVDNICKSYGEHIVFRNFSASFETGITCIMSPSGAGKTTLLRIILGLETPDSGSVSVPSGCRWAVVFQEDRLLEHLNAEKNLRFALGRSFSRSRSEQILSQLGLNLYETDPVRTYSGGMKRRLALARALLAESDAVILDEPFSGLDEDNRMAAIACIRKETAGKIVLLVTHDSRDVSSLDAKSFIIGGQT